MFYSASNWEPPCPRARNVIRHCGIDQLAHEWFHYLQWQIGNQTFADAPEWMSEGAAIWGGDMGLLLADGQQSFSQTREGYRQDAARTTVTLQGSEERNTPWQYRLGALAVDLLVERAGFDAVVEYYRQMHHQSLESDRRYTVATDWPEAFRNAFGITVEDFYEEFEAWRSELPHEGPRYDYYRDDRTLHGSLRDAAGNPATGFWINTEPYIGENKSGRIRRTHVRDDGTFSIDLVPNTTQRLWITHDGCALWLTEDGLATMRPEASEHRLLDTRNLSSLNLQLPVDACRVDLQVDVLRLRGDDRRVTITLNSEDGRKWIPGLADGADSRVANVSEPSRYRVMVRVGGCDLWYAAGRLVSAREDADSIELGDALISLEVRIPHDLCVRQISGRLIDADEAPISEVWLTASGNRMSSGTSPDVNGDFTITVPDSDTYRLSVWLDEHDCRVYYRRGESPGTRQQATAVNVNDRDVTGVRFQLTDGLCSTKIAGRLLDSTGEPISDAQVWIRSDDGVSGSRTDSDGMFSIAVLQAGGYRVGARIDGCSIFHRRGGVTGEWDQATEVRVSNDDIAGLRLQLAEGMCERRISGRLLNPDGSPHANQWVRACGSEGCGGATSGADGSFAFAVPASGTYRLETGFGDCRIRHGSSGPTEHWNSAKQITVSNADVTGIEFRLPEDPSSFCN